MLSHRNLTGLKLAMKHCSGDLMSSIVIMLSHDCVSDTETATGSAYFASFDFLRSLTNIKPTYKNQGLFESWIFFILLSTKSGKLLTKKALIICMGNMTLNINNLFNDLLITYSFLFCAACILVICAILVICDILGTTWNHR